MFGRANLFTKQPQTHLLPASARTQKASFSATNVAKAVSFNILISFIPKDVPKLPDLAFDYAELQPYISGEIMEVHHKGHHQAYVNNYIAAMDKYRSAE